MTPGGIRMGTPALTSRYKRSRYLATLFALLISVIFHSGFTEEDFDQVAEFFDRSVSIASAVKEKAGPKLKDFKAILADGGLCLTGYSPTTFLT